MSKVWTAEELRDMFTEILNGCSPARGPERGLIPKHNILHHYYCKIVLGHEYTTTPKEELYARLSLEALNRFLDTAPSQEVKATPYAIPGGLSALNPWERLGQLLSAFKDLPTNPPELGHLSYFWQLQDALNQEKGGHRALWTRSSVVKKMESEMRSLVEGNIELCKGVACEMPFVSRDGRYAHLSPQGQRNILSECLGGALINARLNQWRALEDQRRALLDQKIDAVNGLLTSLQGAQTLDQVNELRERFQTVRQLSSDGADIGTSPDVSGKKSLGNPNAFLFSKKSEKPDSRDASGGNGYGKNSRR